jgi:hypothetical protein
LTGTPNSLGWEVAMRGLFANRHMETVRVLKALRLAFSGAVLGAAVAGLLSGAVKVEPEFASTFGAVGGFIVVAAIKIAHII